MTEAILPFKEALAAATAAADLEHYMAVVDDVTRRLHAANSALAVDSACQILEALSLSMRIKNGA